MECFTRKQPHQSLWEERKDPCSSRKGAKGNQTLSPANRKLFITSNKEITEGDQVRRKFFGGNPGGFSKKSSTEEVLQEVEIKSYNGGGDQ